MVLGYNSGSMFIVGNVHIHTNEMSETGVLEKLGITIYNNNTLSIQQLSLLRAVYITKPVLHKIFG